jgi:hypothetical protein
MVEPDFIPSTPLDLVVLRDKFVEAVRRHLLAEVTLRNFFLFSVSLGVEVGWKCNLSVSKRSSQEILKFLIILS